MHDFSLPGIGVAIVAPGGYAPDDAAFTSALTRLKSYGCTVHSYYEPSEKFQRFGAPDQIRLKQLQEAAANPNVQIVMSLRGGYGLSRLLPQIDFRKMAASGKFFVGHSDFTPFHIGLLQEGAVSFAGPMVSIDFTNDPASDYTLPQFAQCLYGPEHQVTVQSENNPKIDVSGTLWGGNLAMLTNLLGTPFMHVADDGILFLEDVAEHPYRIERMILQLLYAGVLHRQKVVMLGDFSLYRLTDYDNGYDFEAMLAYLRQTLPIPVLTGLPFGHIRDKTTLPVGAKGHLVSDGDGWQLTMRDYPTLSR